MEINVQRSDSTAGRGTDPARAQLAHPLATAIEEWFDHYPLPQIPGLSVGAGPNSFFEPSRSLFVKMLGAFDCGLKILDLGCGFGEDAITLSGETNQVWGIDIAEQRLNAARAHVRRANRSDRIFIRKMDVHDLQFADKFFDLIFANSFLMWVNKSRAVTECHRVLKPGGKVVFACESMGKNPFLALHRHRPILHTRESVVSRMSLQELSDLSSRFSSAQWEQFYVALHQHRRTLHTRESLVSRITLQDLSDLSSRFSSAQWEQFYLLSPLLFPLALRFPRSGILRRIIMSVQYLDMRILRSFPRSRHYAWVSVVEFIK